MKIVYIHLYENNLHAIDIFLIGLLLNFFVNYLQNMTAHRCSLIRLYTVCWPTSSFHQNDTDNSKNGMWILPFKKFSRITVKMTHRQFSELSIIIFGDFKFSWFWPVTLYQYRAWSDCTKMPTGLALYFWQMLITFGGSRLRVKVNIINVSSQLKKHMSYIYITLPCLFRTLCPY